MKFILGISVYLNLSLYFMQLARDGAECSGTAEWNAVGIWTEEIWGINHSYTQLPQAMILGEFKIREKHPTCNT